MKLLILNYEYPPLGGGAGRCANYQAEGLAAHGHEITVITTWFEGEKEMEESRNLRLIRLKSRRRKAYQSNPIEMGSWAIKTLRYIRRSKLYLNTDLILAHFTLPGGMVALPVKLSYNIPYYIISHGQDIPWFSPRELFLYHLIFYLPIKLICSKASRIMVLSPRRLKDLNKVTGRKHRSKNYIIPNGCDIDFFTPSEEEKNVDTFKILFTGRLTIQKDPFTMLKAVRSLSNSEIPCNLEVIGDGPLREKMEHFIKTHHLEEKVTFCGWISREELREKYRNAHLLAITSRDEGMSLAMMEALSSGLYVLTTRVSGSESLIREDVNGEFIPFKDPEQLAAGLRSFYKEKLLKNYRVPDQILEELRHAISWDHYVKAYDQIIRQ